MSLKTEIYTSKAHKEKFCRKTQFIDENAKRVRQPVTRSKGRVVGYYPSVKSKRSVAWESQMELKACRIFEYCPTVSNYREQPEVVRYKLNGKEKRYIPDFELKLINDERVFIEIKPKKVLVKNEEKERFVAISDYLTTRSITFAVMTEEELNVGYIQDSIKLIHPYSALDISPVLENYFKELRIESDLTIGKLIQLGITLKSIYTSITKGLLNIDLTQEISLQSLVFINKEKDHENSIYSCRTAPDFK